MKRRQFIWLIAAAPFAFILTGRSRFGFSGEAAGEKSLDRIRKNWKALLARDAKVTFATEPLRKSNADWKQILGEAEFYVLRQEGTERPFSSPLNNEKRPGVYACAGCALPLFTSEMKFDSGTGWPSFFTHIPGHLGTKQDFKLILPRTEYHCVRCGGHHGHVFDDGPPPTRQRWCNNGVALRFIPA
ncbi:MAG: peptide-methionine (R)-S-oxide reductase MsrB [Deltaproteobacteria bacterium]|nr:peptide-methionine (R)-S-oxide reductase MsrB [Deltaproteobacteria bacterium]